ncbi:MAG: transcription antitermination factor NusB [Chromatiales bacterium]
MVGQDTRGRISRKRTLARRAAVQGLYQWQVSGLDLRDVESLLLGDSDLLDELGADLRDMDIAYFRELLRGVAGRASELDAALGPFMDRPMAGVDPVEKAILRIGAFELVQRPEIPYRVVINEAVDLAKTFGAEQGHRFVNGVLDRLAAQARAVERRR